MRLWSLHPRYLDPKGLVALWREGLLAQAVIAGHTRGYRHHPQLTRFWQAPDPGGTIAAYLRAVQAEAAERGYRFDAGRIGDAAAGGRLQVTDGQLRYEREHLMRKLAIRAPEWHERFTALDLPDPHPLFRVVPGGVADWEVISPPR